MPWGDQTALIDRVSRTNFTSGGLEHRRVAWAAVINTGRHTENVHYRKEEVQRDWIAADLKDEHRHIHLFRELLEADDLDVKALTVQGMTAEKLLAEADKLGASLLVIGSHRHGLLQEIITNSAQFDILRKAQCPVLVVPSQQD